MLFFSGEFVSCVTVCHYTHRLSDTFSESNIQCLLVYSVLHT